jgi:hypothetical protein
MRAREPRKTLAIAPSVAERSPTQQRAKRKTPTGSSMIAISCTTMYAIEMLRKRENRAIHWCASGGAVVWEKPPNHFSFHGLNQ